MRKGLSLCLGTVLLSPMLVLAEDAAPASPAPAPGTLIAPALPADQGMMIPGGMYKDSYFGNVDGSNWQPQVWASAEYLLWWTKAAPVNAPLLTLVTNPSDDTSGALGSANTAVLLGDRSYGLGAYSGGRFTLGGWLDPCAGVGVEASYLFLSPNSTTQQFGTNGSPGSPTIGIPYLNAVNNREQVLRLAGPNFPTGPAGSLEPRAGGAFMTITNSLQSAELNGLGQLYCCNGLSVCGLAGFRYLYFKEDLTFGAGYQNLPTGPVPINPITTIQQFGGAYSSIDHFQGVNNFYGGQLGLRGQYQCGCFFINTSGKVALGDMYQTVNIDGGAVNMTRTTQLTTTYPVPGTTTIPGTTTAYPAGFFAQTTNIGHASRQQFAVVPEFNLNVGCNLTRNIRAYVGYTILYVNNVVRPGDQLDHSINPTQPSVLTAPGITPTGPPAPTFPFNHTDFWAQGINFGVAVGW